MENTEKDKFAKIRKYLEHIQNATYEIYIDEETLFQFKIKQFRKEQYVGEKWFTIHYCDSFMGDKKLNSERPRWHYYYLQFEQPYVAFDDGNIGTVSEWKWYQDEEDVLYRIKTLKNRYY